MTERGGKAKGQGKSKGHSGSVKHKQSKDQEAAEQALGALGRTRAPFIVDESVIAPANDTTFRAGSESEPSVEITLEEWPAKVGESGQLYGHRGWVAGGDEGEEEEESGASAPKSQVAHAAATDPSQRLKSKVAAKQAERDGQGGPTIPKGKKLAAAKKRAGALKGGTGRQSLGGVLPKRKRDEFSLNSEDEDERVPEEESGNHSPGAEEKSGGTKEKPKPTSRGGSGTGGGEASRDGRSSAGARVGQDGREEPDPVNRSGSTGKKSGGAGERSPSTKSSGGNARVKAGEEEERVEKRGGEGANPESGGGGPAVSTGSVPPRVVVRVPVLDEPLSRSEVKSGRRAIAKQAKEEARIKAGTEKRVQRDFDEFVEEIRQAEPLQLQVEGKSHLVVWTRKSALTACEAVGLTAEILRQSSDDQVDDAVNARPDIVLDLRGRVRRREAVKVQVLVEVEYPPARVLLALRWRATRMAERVTSTATQTRVRAVDGAIAGATMLSARMRS
jgi:hypothetical protein